MKAKSRAANSACVNCVREQFPSEFIIDAQIKQREMLPFDDEPDFEGAVKSFIAAPDYIC